MLSRCRTALLALTIFSAPIQAFSQEAKDEAGATSSDDVTNRVHRVDLALEVSEPDGEEPEQKWTLRYQQPFALRTTARSRSG